MPIDRDECKRIFCRKGFTTEEGSKHTNLFFKSDGKKTRFKTHLPRGGHGKILDGYLIEQMAQQLNLTKEEFLGFYECKYNQNDYVNLVKKKLGPDPLDFL